MSLIAKQSGVNQNPRLILIGKVEEKSVKFIFKYLLIFTACYMAFAHGGNNMVGVVVPIIQIINPSSDMSIWFIILGGIGIATGITTWGHRVTETIGNQITELTFLRGFSAEFATVILLFISSALGVQISITQTLVGGVIGVGITQNIAGLNSKIIKRIILSWIFTIPFVAAMTISIYTTVVALI